MSVHRMTLVSFRLFRKNLGNLQEFFGQMVRRPPWQKSARPPMIDEEKCELFSLGLVLEKSTEGVVLTIDEE